MTMCHAILYTFPRYGKVSQNMKDYIYCNECLRIKLFSSFKSVDVNIEPLSPGHLCCSVCAEHCKCSGVEDHKCNENVSFLFKTKLKLISNQRLLEMLQRMMNHWFEVCLHNIINVKLLLEQFCCNKNLFLVSLKT